MTLFSCYIMSMSQFPSPLMSTIALPCLTSAAQILLCGLLIGSSCLLSKVRLPGHEGSNAHFYDALFGLCYATMSRCLAHPFY